MEAHALPAVFPTHHLGPSLTGCNHWSNPGLRGGISWHTGRHALCSGVWYIGGAGRCANPLGDAAMLARAVDILLLLGRLDSPCSNSMCHCGVGCSCYQSKSSPHSG